MTWYAKVTDDLDNIPDFITYYEKELAQAKKEVQLHGNLEKQISALPGISEHRFNQLQEIEAVLQFLEIEHRKTRRKYFKKYLEGYNKALSSRDAEKYADGEEDVIAYELLINEVALLRNKYIGVMKGLETKNFMSGHIVKLRTAGMEDVVV